MNNDKLKAGIDMRIALLAYAKAIHREITAGEAEFYEAGYQAGEARAARRVTTLEAESADLHNRPSAEVMMATAQRLIAELNEQPDDVDEDCRNCQARGIGHMHSELLVHMASECAAALAECASAKCLDTLTPATTILGMPVPASATRMVLCPTCSNKRCPHANDHEHACTGSNEPGQPGSAYPAAPTVARAAVPTGWRREEEDLIRAALELGHDLARERAAEIHATLKGHRPEQHAAVDADVELLGSALVIELKSNIVMKGTTK